MYHHNVITLPSQILEPAERREASSNNRRRGSVHETAEVPSDEHRHAGTFIIEARASDVVPC